MKTPQELAAPLAVELTIITGEMWREHKETDNTLTAIYSPSAYLSLWTGYGMNGRVQITATTPREIREPTRGDKITCDMNRTPEAIAQDIKNRLLSHARDHFAKSKAYDLRKRKEEAAANLRKNLVKQYAPEEYNGKLYKPAKNKDDWSQMWVDITNYNNTAKIEISLPFREALRLLEHIENGEYIK